MDQIPEASGLAECRRREGASLPRARKTKALIKAKIGAPSFIQIEAPCSMLDMLHSRGTSLLTASLSLQ
jgi:hypothetical protein